MALTQPLFLVSSDKSLQSRRINPPPADSEQGPGGVPGGVRHAALPQGDPLRRLPRPRPRGRRPGAGPAVGGDERPPPFRSWDAHCSSNPPPAFVLPSIIVRFATHHIFPALNLRSNFKFYECLWFKFSFFTLFSHEIFHTFTPTRGGERTAEVTRPVLWGGAVLRRLGLQRGVAHEGEAFPISRVPVFHVFRPQVDLILKEDVGSPVPLSNTLELLKFTVPRSLLGGDLEVSPPPPPCPGSEPIRHPIWVHKTPVWPKTPANHPKMLCISPILINIIIYQPDQHY